MTRRARWTLAGVALPVVAGLVVAAVAARSGSDCPPKFDSGPLIRGPVDPRHPNILLVLTDDQRWDTLWAMTNVRRLLGGHGVTFANAFVTTSICCPSRVGILTGQASRHTGVYGDVFPQGGAKSFADSSSLATWLHDGGYRTALVGKYLNQYELLGDRYIPPGWDEWDVIAHQPQFRYHDYDLNENGALVHYGKGDCNYSTDVLAGIAERFLRGARAPFFLSFDPIAPHPPADPLSGDAGRFAARPPDHPPSFNEPDISDKPWAGSYGQEPQPVEETDGLRERQAESLQAVDRAVGRFVALLEAKGQLENTVILFTSDNGFLLGEHRLSQKVWPYEESIRVPLVIRAPWIAPPGRTDRRFVLNVDLASTMAELAGVRPRLPQDGRSLVPLLRGRPPSPPWRTSFVVEFLGRPSLQVPPPFEALRTERYLWVEYRNGWRELYDLKTDPYELANLAVRRSTSELQRALHAQLAAQLRE